MECHPCQDWLMRIVDPFLAVWPDVELDVTSAFQFRGLAALLGHEIDLLVTHDPVERLGPDYLRLLQAAERGEVDIIVAESLNRLSRDQADTAPLFKRMSFFGDRLHTIADQDEEDRRSPLSHRGRYVSPLDEGEDDGARGSQAAPHRAKCGGARAGRPADAPEPRRSLPSEDR
ncbi:recombinase family protein [Tritonibacter mobilis]